MNKVVIILLSIGFLSSCKKEERVPIPITFEEAIEVDLTNSDTIIEQEDIRIWSSRETGLPMGTVIDRDCANRGEKDQVEKDNYVLIKKLDNVCTIKTDINEDLFLSLKIGDRIID